jgi:hypothetical protein
VGAHGHTSDSLKPGHGKVSIGTGLESLAIRGPGPAGVVPNSGGRRWVQALAIRLDQRLGRLWLLIEPTVWIEREEGELVDSTCKEFVRQRLAQRYNDKVNTLLNAWIGVITDGKDLTTVSAFENIEGVNAAFTIQGSTGFSRRAPGGPATTPAEASAWIADSRPLPGPWTRTCTRRSPRFMASRPQFSAATVAAKGVDFLEPLKPAFPAEPHARALPRMSVMVMSRLLNMAEMWAIPSESTTFLERFGLGALPGVGAVILLLRHFLLAGDGAPGTLLGPGVGMVRCPRTGSPRRCRMPR